MNQLLRKLLPLLMLLGLENVGRSQGVCSEAELNACSTDLKSAVCLELYHACGRYEDIIENFKLDQLKDTTAKFYAGMSFYGLFHRTRVKSIQCEYADQARNLLSEFVMEIKQNKGFRNQAEFRQVYRGSKAITDLKTTTGCLEQGMSILDVQFHSQKYGEELMKKLFIRKAGSGSGLDSAIADLKANIQGIVRAITSKAAEIEAQLSMRRQALQASNRSLDKLVQTYKEFFGSADVSLNARGYQQSIDLTVSSTSPFTSAEKLSTNFLHRSQKVDQAVSAALGAVSAQAYQMAKISLITRAQDESTLASASYTQGLDLISPQGSGSNLASLVSSLKASTSNDKSLDIHKKLKADWTTVLAANCATNPRSWICQDPNGGTL